MRDVGFGTRLGSAFENGYGDEGILAKLVYLLFMGVLMVINLLLWPFYGAYLLWRKLRKSPTAELYRSAKSKLP
jgi:hypothetical protein